MSLIDVEINVDKHPYEEGFINENTKYLIVGTIPPYRFCKGKSERVLKDDEDVDWFYGSKDNRFWDLISKITKQKSNNLSTIESRKDFVKEKNIGFIDLFNEIYRFRDSSSDNNIIPKKIVNIFVILRQYKNINTILFTSTDLQRLMTSLYNELENNYVNRISKRDNKEFDFINLEERKIKWVTLKSPSPRNNNSLDSIEKEWERVFIKLNII